MQVTPKGDLVLCKVADAEDKTTGGVLLPESAQKKPTSGKDVDMWCSWHLMGASREFCSALAHQLGF